MKTSNRKWYAILCLGGILAYYVIAFYGVVKSWYMYDDLINYTAEGYCINHDISVFKLTKDILLHWYKSNGRVFFLSSWTYILFSLVENVYLYKLLIVLATFLNGVLLAKLVNKITLSNTLSFLVLFLFPVFIPLDCSWYNAMYGFHMLLQVCLCWSLFSMLAFWKYINTNQVRWQVISCIFLSLSLGTYEIAYVLCAVFVILALVQTRSILLTIKKLIPQIVTGVLWLGWNVIARMQASSEYVGTKVSLAGAECFKALFKQISGSCSAISLFWKDEILTQENILLALQKNGIRYIILALIICIVVVCASKKKDNMANKGMVYVIGALMIVGPAMLIAISERYQNEVDWGRGYLPAYVSCWGFVICIAGFVTKLKNKLAIWGVAILCGLCMIFNQMVSDISVDNHNSGNIDSFVAEAVDAGVLDEVGEEDILIEGCATWAEVDSHYAFLVKRKVNAVSWITLFEVVEGKVNTTELFDNLKKKEFYYTGFQKDRCFVAAKCMDLNIWLGDVNNICRAFLSDSFDIYIPHEINAESIAYITQEGKPQELLVSMCEVRNKTENGSVYKIKLDEAINVETIAIK